MQPVKTLGIIGAGNLAWNLAHNLRDSHWSVEQVISRTHSRAREMAENFGIPLANATLEEVHPDLDLLLLGVPDRMIPELTAKLLPHLGRQTILVHTSGTTPLAAIEMAGAERTGVLWPMQTLRKERLTSLREVPVFIEGGEKARELVRGLAFALSDKVTYLNSEQRLRMHLAAVFAGNFPTMMLQFALEASEGLPDVGPDTFAPLALRSLQNALETTPLQALTGPARRGDQPTLDRHADLLQKNSPELTGLYDLLNKLIRERFPEND